MSPVIKVIHTDMLKTGAKLTLHEMRSAFHMPPMSDLKTIIRLSGGFKLVGNKYQAIPVVERPKTAQWRCMDKLGRVRSVFELAQ